MDKIQMQSVNGVSINIEKIAALFPNCVTETKDNKGNLCKKVDFEKLQEELSDDVIGTGKERYQFTWPDKRQAIHTANTPTSKSLRPFSKNNESVDFENTQNLYIEGNNLDVLKILRENYFDKIKAIYIDPPYNTGKDQIYEDNYNVETSLFSNMNGEKDEEGNRMVVNLDSEGRFHTKWLNSIYPQLKISRDLLTDQGILFISIDENEVDNLHKICNEIYGERNFVGQFVWQNKKGGGNDSVHIAVEHEYILVYAKNKNELKAFYECYSEEYAKRYKEEDDKGRFFWDTFKRKSGKQYYPIECPDGTVLQYDEDGNAISWLRSKERFENDKNEGEIRIIKIGEKWSVQFKQRMPEGKKPRSIFLTNTLIEDKGTTSTGSADVFEYFKKDVFSNPKPIELLKFLLGFGVNENDIVLDFYSGSGTTADAVFRLNALYGGHRKFILVQIAEQIDKMLNSANANAKRVAENAINVLEEIGKPHYLTELAKERIRRAAKKIKEEMEAEGKDTSKMDFGFRVLKLDSSNMKDVYYKPQDTKVDLFSEENVKEDRTAEDLLFQVMPKCDLMLSEKIVKENIKGKDVYFVKDNYLAACFDKDLTDDVIKEIAQRKPFHFVMREGGAKTDSVLDNFEQIFKTYSAGTKCMVI